MITATYMHSVLYGGSYIRALDVIKFTEMMIIVITIKSYPTKNHLNLHKAQRNNSRCSDIIRVGKALIYGSKTYHLHSVWILFIFSLRTSITSTQAKIY